MTDRMNPKKLAAHAVQRLADSEPTDDSIEGMERLRGTPQESMFVVDAAELQRVIEGTLEDAISAPTPPPPSETLTLKHITDWAQTARMFIAHNHLLGGDSREALEAIFNLENQARRTLDSPNRVNLKWALQNDPYCRAAYAHGAREMQRRMEDYDV